MKKGQVLEALVERVDFPCKGIARTEEGPVIVKNSLPGQKIRLSVNKVRNGKAEGRLLEVLEKAPSETVPPCSHFGVCGGCVYLPLPYEEQLKLKEQQVWRLLECCLKGQEASWNWEGILGSPAAFGYRNKMEFTFGDEVKDGPLALGMHKRGSFYDVVTVDDCRIVDEDYRLILGSLREYFAHSGARHFHRLTHRGYLRHLLVRKAWSTGQILVALVTTSQDPWGEEAPREEGAVSGWGVEEGTPSQESLLEGYLHCLLELQSSGRLKGRFAGILHIVNDSQADVVRSDRTDVLYGQDYFHEEILGLRFKVSLFSFFQTNSAGAEVLYGKVREYIGESEGSLKEASDKLVFDLYSGTGTIAQIAAPAAGRVIGVEIVEEAVLAAEKNARENGIGNCTFIAGDVLKVLEGLEERPDLVILDPPRDGMHPKALLQIASRFRPERLVYISCKPTSLVRDLEVFQEHGYKVVRACCVDMFPWTANVETVVLLSQQKPDEP